MSTAEHDNTSMLIAWDLLKLKLATEKWTVSDHFNSQGFFAWGWAARKQYDTPMQTRITELEAQVADLELKLLTERGAKAWKDVPNATAFVEELRGNKEST